jgi:hypothetical protein
MLLLHGNEMKIVYHDIMEMPLFSSHYVLTSQYIGGNTGALHSAHSLRGWERGLRGKIWPESQDGLHDCASISLF